MRLIGQPGQSYIIQLYSSYVNKSFPDVADYLKEDKSNQVVVILEVDLRKCRAGEAFLTSGECRQCVYGTYVLQPLESPHQCFACDDDAECLGGNQIVPKPGFWRENEMSLTFYHCFNGVACLGKDQNSGKYNPSGDCRKHYHGILCSQCDIQYSMNSSFECSKCPDKAQNVLIMISVIFILLAGVVIVIKITLKSATLKKSTFSIYFKSFFTHIQLLFLVSSFKLEWPTQVQKFFKTTSSVSDTPQDWYSLDCVVQDFYQNDTSRFYFYLSIYFALPIVAMIISTLFWRLRYRKRNQWKIVKRKTCSTLLIFYFIIHSPVTKMMMQSFHCFKINENYRLVKSMQQVCWSGKHLTYSLLIGGSGIILWVIGIPLLTFVMLYDERKRLKHQDVKEQYGFLYNGFTTRSYYWKILITFVAVFLTSYGTMIQALILFIILLVFIFMTIKIKPYQNAQLNALEVISFIALIITAYAGIFFISSRKFQSSEFKDGRDFYLTDSTRWFLFIVILIVNLVFLLYWFWNLFADLRANLRSKFPRFYVICCLCCNRKLYTEEITVEKQMIENNQIIKRIDGVKLDLGDFRLLYLNNEKFESKKLFQEFLISFASSISKLKAQKAMIFMQTKRRVFKNTTEQAKEIKIDSENFLRQQIQKDDFQIQFDFEHQISKKVQNQIKRQRLRHGQSIENMFAPRRSITKTQSSLLKSFQRTIADCQSPKSRVQTKYQEQELPRLRKQRRNTSALMSMSKLHQSFMNPHKNAPKNKKKIKLRVCDIQTKQEFWQMGQQQEQQQQSKSQIKLDSFVNQTNWSEGEYGQDSTSLEFVQN